MVAIVPKRSSTASAVPTSGQLSIGEIAINLADGLMYSKKADGTVITIGGSGGGGGTPSQLRSGGFISLNTTNDASAVNYLEANASNTNTAVTLSAKGTDTDISISITPKGAGSVNVPTVGVLDNSTKASSTAFVKSYAVSRGLGLAIATKNYIG